MFMELGVKEASGGINIRRHGQKFGFGVMSRSWMMNILMILFDLWNFPLAVYHEVFPTASALSKDGIDWFLDT